MNYVLKIAYDGTAYHGWQRQKNGITVQEVMESTLEKLLGAPTAVTGCSRTDAGVHAGKAERRRQNEQDALVFWIQFRNAHRPFFDDVVPPV